VEAPPDADSGQAATSEGDSATATKSERRLNPIKLRQMRERRSSIEEEVTKLEAEIADYESALTSFVSAEETRRLASLLDARRADLTALMTEWEEVSEALDVNS
jgi:ATP-binding cassette subfamily F protein 3